MNKKKLPIQPSLVKNKTIIMALDQILKPIRKDHNKKWINLKWFVVGTVVFGLVVAGITKIGLMGSKPNDLQSEALTNELSVNDRKPASNPPFQNSDMALELSQLEATPTPDFIEYPTNPSESLSTAGTQHEHVNLDHRQNDHLNHSHEQNPEDHLSEEVYDSY